MPGSKAGSDLADADTTPNSQWGRLCIPCLEVRLALSDRLLGFYDRGQPWEQWGCPIDGCGRWFLGPWDLEWHTVAGHPGWTATYELLRPYPNQRQRVVYRRSEPPAS